MNCVRKPKIKQIVYVTLSASLVTGGIFILQSQAIAQNPLSNLVQRIILLVNPPLDQKPVGRVRGGAGRRGICPRVEHPVAAFVPFKVSDSGTVSDKESESRFFSDDGAALLNVGSTTAQDSPTFWFYVPFSPDNVETVEFMILNAEQAPLIEPVVIQLTQTPGIVRIDSPIELEAGEHYNWYFSAICDEFSPSHNPGVSGWIYRTEASIDIDSDSMSLQDEYKAYANESLWHEMMTTLIEAKLEAPNNAEVLRDWQLVLDSLGLEAIADEPIVECCIIGSGAETAIEEPLF